MRHRHFNAMQSPGIGMIRRAVDSPDMGIITAKLRAALEADGRSLSELERVTGISKAALSRLKSGEREVSIDTAEKLFKVFGIKLEFKTKATTKSK